MILLSANMTVVIVRLFGNGDCTAFREMYPGCLAPRPDWVGDGICNDGLYAKPECKYDGGTV